MVQSSLNNYFTDATITSSELSKLNGQKLKYQSTIINMIMKLNLILKANTKSKIKTRRCKKMINKLKKVSR